MIRRSSWDSSSITAPFSMLPSLGTASPGRSSTISPALSMVELTSTMPPSFTRRAMVSLFIFLRESACARPCASPVPRRRTRTTW